MTEHDRKREHEADDDDVISAFNTFLDGVSKGRFGPNARERGLTGSTFGAKPGA